MLFFFTRLAVSLISYKNKQQNIRRTRSGCYKTYLRFRSLLFTRISKHLYKSSIQMKNIKLQQIQLLIVGVTVSMEKILQQLSGIE